METQQANKEQELSTAEMAERVLAKLIELADARATNGGTVTLQSRDDIEVKVDGLNTYCATVTLPCSDGADFADTVASLYEALCRTRGRGWR